MTYTNMKKLLVSVLVAASFCAPAATLTSQSFIRGIFVQLTNSNAGTVLYGATNLQYIRPDGSKVKSGSHNYYSNPYSTAPGSNGIETLSYSYIGGVPVTNTWTTNSTLFVYPTPFVDVKTWSLTDGGVATNAAIRIVLESKDLATATNSITFSFAKVAGPWADNSIAMTAVVTMRAGLSNIVQFYPVSTGTFVGADSLRLAKIAFDATALGDNLCTNIWLKSVDLIGWKP